VAAETDGSPRARRAAASATALAIVAGCLPTLPDPVQRCTPPKGEPAGKCNDAFNSARSGSCITRDTATQCLVTPTKMDCAGSCAPVPACAAGACPTTVLLRESGAACSLVHKETVGGATGTTACYAYVCAPSNCLDACDGRGPVIGTNKDLLFDQRALVTSKLESVPSAGALGVYVRIRGLIDASIVVQARSGPVKSYPLPSSSDPGFQDVVLPLDAGNGGDTYTWSNANDAPTSIVLSQGVQYGAMEIDCIVPFLKAP
jgi:hypothetical protein